jgi:hypothetical protein
VDESEIDFYFQEPRVPWNTASALRGASCIAVAFLILLLWHVIISPAPRVGSVPAERHFSDAGEQGFSLFPALLLVLDHNILDALTTTTIHYLLVISYSLFTIHYPLFSIHYPLPYAARCPPCNVECCRPYASYTSSSPFRHFYRSFGALFHHFPSFFWVLPEAGLNRQSTTLVSSHDIVHNFGPVRTGTG